MEGQTDADGRRQTLTYFVGDNVKVWREAGGGMGCTVSLYEAMVLFVVYLLSIVKACVAVLTNPGMKQGNADRVTHGRAIGNEPCVHSC